MTGGTLALFARNQPGVLHTDLEACGAWKSGPEAARKVRCPALVVIAANDIMTPPKAGRELAGLIAGGRAVTDRGLRPHAAGRGARRGARCADRFLRAGRRPHARVASSVITHDRAGSILVHRGWIPHCDSQAEMTDARERRGIGWAGHRLADGRIASGLNSASSRMSASSTASSSWAARACRSAIASTWANPLSTMAATLCHWMAGSIGRMRSCADWRADHSAGR